MNCVALDTSGKRLTWVIIKNGEFFVYNDPDCGVNHSVSVMTELEKLLIKADFDLKDADFFACVTGAGSFTGIRIGVSTIKALAFSYNKPVLSVTSFDTLAYDKAEGNVLAVIDAGHNGYYVCPYRNGVAGNAVYALKDGLSEYDGFSFVAETPLAGLNVTVVSPVEGLKKALILKAGSKNADINSLVPLYVRKSQAEEGRK